VAISDKSFLFRNVCNPASAAILLATNGTRSRTFARNTSVYPLMAGATTRLTGYKVYGFVNDMNNAIYSVLRYVSYCVFHEKKSIGMRIITRQCNGIECGRFNLLVQAVLVSFCAVISISDNIHMKFVCLVYPREIINVISKVIISINNIKDKKG
jgi:hypothetical protein